MGVNCFEIPTGIHSQLVFKPNAQLRALSFGGIFNSSMSLKYIQYSSFVTYVSRQAATWHDRLYSGHSEWPDWLWHDIGTTLWLSRHGTVGTASRQVPNVCKKIVYACRTMSGHPDMARRIFTILSQIVYKLPEVVRPFRPSRQVATRCGLFVQNVRTKCLDLSGHTGSRGRSEQLVATGRATGSPRFLFQPC